jgi:shikimate dehydrogenase
MLRQITASTQVCAIIKDPVEHSLSPQIHNAAFQSLNLDMVYTAFHVRSGRLCEAIMGVRALGVRGLSVTIPHKVDILSELDELDSVSRHVHSVNTVVNDGGSLKGYTSDGYGALRALSAADVSLAGASIVVIGSGGAARAICFTLATVEPFPKVAILGIDEREGQDLRRDLCEATGLPVTFETLQDDKLQIALESASLVIQATPVGMSPKEGKSPIPSYMLREDLAVFDIVYTPLETRLLKEASGVGAKTISGLGMFVHQAAAQFELWTGRKAPVDVMTAAVEKSLAP